MLATGSHEGVIVSHRSKMLGDKIAMAITCTIGNEKGETIIFLTEKAMGMARRALKVCGFDVDALHGLLNGQPLAGQWPRKMLDLYAEIQKRMRRHPLDAAAGDADNNGGMQ